MPMLLNWNTVTFTGPAGITTKLLADTNRAGHRTLSDIVFFRMSSMPFF